MEFYDFPEEVRRQLIAMHLSPYGELVGEPEMGAFGEIYTLKALLPVVAKCPRIQKFGSVGVARDAIGRLAVEFEKVVAYWRHHGVQRYSNIVIIHRWPFLLARRRHGTLADLIAGPTGWTTADKLLCIIQICRALSHYQRAGLVAHQDLKPANVFVDDVWQTHPDLKTGTSIRYKTFVADFGLADAFRDFGRNAGSRPYMAPEQYEKGVLEDGSAIDVFALGVIAFECLADGMHPIGERTSDIWPVPMPGKPAKWKHEDVWKNWARRADKVLPIGTLARPAPAAALREIEKALCPDPAGRPTVEQFESGLSLALAVEVGDQAQLYRYQLDAFEELFVSPEDVGWPHIEECLVRLRRLYSQTTG